MKTEFRKVYFCEHCRKNMISAGSMARHEKYCKYKPENRHKCFDTCRYLKRNIKLIKDSYDPEDPHSYRTVLSCEKRGIEMYSYLLEKKANFQPFFIKDLIRMPVKCALHEHMTESEYEKRFNPEES